MKHITRRSLLSTVTSAVFLNPLFAAIRDDRFDRAVAVLEDFVQTRQVRAASLFVQSGSDQLSQSLGEAESPDAAFLLGSISKPIVMAALMTLFHKGQFDLDDRVQKYLPEFRGGYRDRVTIRNLLTHVSGLPDQLPQNAKLRSKHAALEEFVKGALEVPLSFEPGTKYEYSSMGILLAAEIAQRLSGTEIRQFVNQAVLSPLRMENSAMGVGELQPQQIMPCQVEFGAVEAGGGFPDAENWNWNSPYWRQLGAPWGGVHASAPDVGKFLHEFLHPTGILFPPDVASMMIQNHNPAGLESRGLGFDVGMESFCPGCGPATFGHSGSTGTLAWADPKKDLICVVLTTLPGRARPASRHPRQLASDCIAG